MKIRKERERKRDKGKRWQEGKKEGEKAVLLR